jgi:hypothetical protein
MFLLGILDFSRMLFTWVAANEPRVPVHAMPRSATTPPAGQGAGAHAGPAAPGQQHQCQLDPTGCTAATCQSVTVAITGLKFQWIPIVGSGLQAAIPMPGFSTTLPGKSCARTSTAARPAQLTSESPHHENRHHLPNTTHLQEMASVLQSNRTRCRPSRAARPACLRLPSSSGPT